MAKPPSRLGRGLGSLISGGTAPVNKSSTPVDSVPLPTETANTELVNHSTVPSGRSSGQDAELLEIGTDQIVPNPYQPRKTIDPESIKELAASIESEGLLQPVVVRRIHDDYQLIAGERRWRAHQFLKRGKILARVMTTTEISSASLSLIENLQREGLNPLEESMGYHSLVEEFGLTQAKVAERVGKSRSYITNTMRFLQLEEELRTLLADGKISPGHAKVLLGLNNPQLRVSLAGEIVKNGWSVRRCEEEIQRLSVESNKELSSSSARNAEFAPLAKKATSVLNRKVKIQANPGGNGKITFSFQDEIDLKTLLDRLGVR
ncbi:MAG: ParB/RepB/Spo0J family partition protein [Opitutales bacterium]|nr:ParB/RepB/Spo0J family partition protein [Opitutales bacterium]